jgi:hypothetical protein
MAINWTDVESSQIVRVGYDAETLKAYVAFKDRKTGDVQSTYEYSNCPEQVVTDIINSDSAGRQFAATLKYGFQYRKL